MTDRYDEPRLIGQPSNAYSYHTRACRTVRHAKGDAEPVDQSLIEWHDLEECKYCSGDHTPHGSEVAADD